MRNFTFPTDREFLMKRMGDMSQLAGTKRYVLAEGRARGTEALDFKTGTGFCFTVLPGRGMDIAWADYKGVPIGYISKTGVVSAEHYESEGLNWLRSFYGGLMTTCGLSNAGAPSEDELPILGPQKYGLHGRIANICADNLCIKSEWQDGVYVMTAEGRMRESILHGENLTLTRKIGARLGESRLKIQDTVMNEGFRTQPFMLLYHINLGYPLLDNGSRFICNSAQIQAADEASQARLNEYDQIGTPVFGAVENLYFHQPIPDELGIVYTGLINPGLELGVYVQYKSSQLKNLVEWKQLGETEYVLGIEPANCLPVGRQEMKRRGGLEYMEPGEEREFDLEIGILDGKTEIDKFIRLCGMRE